MRGKQKRGQMSKETAITTQSEHQLTLTPEEQEGLAQRAEESVRKGSGSRPRIWRLAGRRAQ